MLDYAKDTLVPFYVIHHPAVLTLASFIVTWQLGLWPKIAIIVVLAYAITVGLHELVSRRWVVTRMIFGLGQRKRRAAEPEAAMSHA